MTASGTLPPATVRPRKKASRQRARLATRTSRRPEEDRPSLDYVERLEQLGPREGESKLAFVKRMGMLRAARVFVQKTWKRMKGNKVAVATELGVHRRSLAYELRYIGFDAEILDRTLEGR